MLGGPYSRPPIRDPEIMARMKMTFELFDLALAMKRQNLRRQSPEASEQEIEEGVRQWLHHRPGAPYGDGEGRPGRRID